MPEVHAVKIADGKRDGDVRSRRDAPIDSHVRPTKSLNFSGFRLAAAWIWGQDAGRSTGTGQMLVKSPIRDGVDKVIRIADCAGHVDAQGRMVVANFD